MSSWLKVPKGVYGNELSVFAVMACHVKWDGSGESICPRKVIRDKTGLSDKAVRIAIKNLLAKGHITKWVGPSKGARERGQGMLPSNTYILGICQSGGAKDRGQGEGPITRYNTLDKKEDSTNVESPAKPVSMFRVKADCADGKRRNKISEITDLQWQVVLSTLGPTDAIMASLAFAELQAKYKKGRGHCNPENLAEKIINHFNQAKEDDREESSKGAIRIKRRGEVETTRRGQKAPRPQRKNRPERVDLTGFRGGD